MTELRKIIDEIRKTREKSLNDDFRRSLGFLRNAFPIPWAYVFELVQNALDARASSIAVRWDERSFDLQHDGTETLERRHVEALSRVSGSTKGAGQIGFMGVGFKSIFHRYRTAQIAANGLDDAWRFKFQLLTEKGELGQLVPRWETTLFPFWDPDAPLPETGMTTRFHLSDRVNNESVEDEFGHLVAKDDLTPLAILALRGLRRIDVQGVRFELVEHGDLISVNSNKAIHNWRIFRRRYQPSLEARRRLLEIRGQLRDDSVSGAEAAHRTIVGLLPLSNDGGFPKPPDKGVLYATLPTGETIPFGIHIQADWLLDLSRRGLQKIGGDPWQTGILDEITGLLRDVFAWMATQSADARKAGLAVLDDASRFGQFDDKDLEKRFIATLRDALGDLPCIPVHGGQLADIETVLMLPSLLAEVFNGRPERRCNALLIEPIFDNGSAHPRTLAFLKWLGVELELEASDFNDPEETSFSRWWDAMAEEHRTEALLGAWRAFEGLGKPWTEVPCVRAMDGSWVRARDVVGDFEPPPSAIKGGSEELVAAWLAPYLPRASERIDAEVQAAVAKKGGAYMFSGILGQRRPFDLRQTIGIIASKAPPNCATMVGLLHWAMTRSNARTGLVPSLFTESGPRIADDSLLADPFVDHGKHLRQLIKKPAVVGLYLEHPSPSEVIAFLKELTPSSRITPRLHYECTIEAQDEDAVRKAIGIQNLWQRANLTGYQIYDYRFPFSLDGATPETLVDVLNREHVELQSVTTKVALGIYRKQDFKISGTTPASWIASLESKPWVPVAGGGHLRPTDVLVEPDDAFVDAPVAKLDAGLKATLLKVGIRFGMNLAKSAAVRRIQRRGGQDCDLNELGRLVQEALMESSGVESELERLRDAIRAIRFKGFPFERLVKRSGGGTKLRGLLGEWVVPLSDLPAELSAAIERVPGLVVPTTTTGRQALAMLSDVWKRSPKNVDELRTHLPLAWRYLREDLAKDQALALEWQEARTDVRLFAGKQWRLLGPDLIVDDLDSPVANRLVEAADIVRVAAGHLGDDPEGVASTADLLGLRRMSTIVRLIRGLTLSRPATASRVAHLLDLIKAATGADVPEVAIVASLRFELEAGRAEAISGIVEDELLLVAGAPDEFAEEAASSLLSALRLSQRVDIGPALGLALAAVEDDGRFDHCGRKLAARLGVEWKSPQQYELEDAPRAADSVAADVDASTMDYAEGPESFGSSTNSAPEERSPAPTATEGQRTWVDRTPDAPGQDNSGTPTEPSSGPRERHREVGAHTSGARSNECRGEPLTPADSAAAVPATSALGGSPKKGLNQFALFAGRPTGHSGTPSTSARLIDEADPFVLRSDAAGRKAVMIFEKLRGRLPTEMDALQPGYDVVSFDPKANVTRRIEVKSMQDDWVDDASVMATHRQLIDALACTSPEVVYWLYVVDRTNTAEPRVFPIPWTREPKLSLGFFAHIWRQCAEEPGVISSDGVRELPADEQP